MAQRTTVSTTTAEQHFSNWETLDSLNPFSDVFDIIDDDQHDDDGNDPLENVADEYNRDFDFNYIHTNVDEEETLVTNEISPVDDQRNEGLQQPILTRESSQLSTEDEHNEETCIMRNEKRHLSSPSTPSATSKRNRTFDERAPVDDETPEYLRVSNKLFDHAMAPHMVGSAGNYTIASLRSLAILKHKIGVAKIERELWTTYLKLGTGQWETQESAKAKVDRRFWALPVKSLVPSTTPADHTNEQMKYENIAREFVTNLNLSIQRFQCAIDSEKSCLLGATIGIEMAMDRFIQRHGTEPVRLKVNHRIAVLECDYDAQLVEREYQRLKPNDEQVQIARRLYNLRYEHLQSKQDLIELKQRILCNRPTEAMNSLSLEVPTQPTANSMDPRTRQRRLDQHEKYVQQKITNHVALLIAEAEAKIHRCRQAFNEEILRTRINDGKGNGSLTGELTDLVYRRFDIIKKKIELIGAFRWNHLIRNRYDRGGDEQNENTSRFSPSIIVDTSSPSLTSAQLRLLSRGPTYVPPCQMYVALSNGQPAQDRINRLYAPLKHHLSILSAKHHVNTAKSMFINKEVKDVFTGAFSISLPSVMQQRAPQEQQLIQSIQQHLKAHDLVLRRTGDLKNVFYLGNRKDFEDEANEYLRKTDLFEISEVIDDTNLQQTYENMTKMVKSINQKIEVIFNNKKLHADQLRRLLIDATKTELPYLYFLPDVSKNSDLSVRPVVVARRSATAGIAHFLDLLLRPVVQRHVQSTTFMNGSDFIRKLNQSIETVQPLHPKTLFAIISISNFDGIASHARMLLVLEGFLQDYLAIPAIENISIRRIIELTSLFLNHNRFYYNRKIYHYTKGSPNGLPLTETLRTIYIFQWQKRLSEESSIRNEFFGRCQNRIFFTWNKTPDELNAILHALNSRASDVHLELTVDKSVEYLDAHVENRNGVLWTRVYHDPKRDTYALPYVLGNSRMAHSHWLRSALIRAVRFCTSVSDFQQERILLEVSCLANGYSLEFVERRIDHFFTYFDAATLRMVSDESVYRKLRHRLFNFINEQTQAFNAFCALEANGQLIRLSYLYEYGPRHKFNQALHRILSDQLNLNAQPSRTRMKFVLTTLHQHSLNALLSQQKPFDTLFNYRMK